MNFLIEILISGSLIIYVLFKTINVNLLNKENAILSTGLISLLLIGFGFYLWIKNGLILDYGTPKEIKNSKAILMTVLGISGVFTGLIFIAITTLKFIIWKLKK